MKTVLFTLVNGEGVIANVEKLGTFVDGAYTVFDPHYLRISEKGAGFQPVAIFSEPGVPHKLLATSISFITEDFDKALADTFLKVLNPNHIIVPDKKIIL